MKTIIHTSIKLANSNPGRGGMAFILRQGDVVIEKAWWIENTTDHRASLIAVNAALTAIRSLNLATTEIIVYLSSSLVKRAIEKDWMSDWIKRGWKNALGSPIKNKKEWVEWSTLVKGLNIKFQHVEADETGFFEDRCSKMSLKCVLSKKPINRTYTLKLISGDVLTPYE